MRVFVYGCRVPAEGLGRITAQLRAANQYANRLIALERVRRAAYRKIIANAGEAEVAALELEEAALERQIEEARDAVRKRRGETRRAAVGTPIEKGVIQRARGELVAVRTKLRAARNQARVIAKPLIEALEAETTTRKKEERATSGVYWGTYLLVEESMERCFESTPIYEDPRFRRWTGEGVLGVQLQGGLPVEDLFGEDRRLRIEPLPEVPTTASRRAQLRRKTVLHFRIGSGERGAPTFLPVPLLVHRPLPDGGIVKWAKLKLSYSGPRPILQLQLVVDEPPLVLPTKTGADIALDIGWRSLPDGSLRVATWADSDGGSGELRITAEHLSSFRKADELRATRDKAFNEVRDALVAWLRKRVEAGGELPAWLLTKLQGRDPETAAATTQQIIAHLALWRSQRRLVALVGKWKEERFDGDAEMLEPLTRWLEHDIHLWKWESDQRRKTARRRLDIYRSFAKDLAHRYRRVGLEKLDLRKFQRLPDVEDAEAQNNHARYMRMVAALSELRTAISQAAARTGADVLELPAENTTRVCHACGSLEEWDQAAEVAHTCSQCGAAWDQDANASRMLLRSMNAGPRRIDPKVQDEGRWARRKKKTGEKEDAPPVSSAGA